MNRERREIVVVPDGPTRESLRSMSAPTHQRHSARKPSPRRRRLPGMLNTEGVRKSNTRFAC